jgi:Transposase DDE domain
VRILWAWADPHINRFVGSSGEAAVPWPHVRQICRVERRRCLLRAGQVVKAEVEISYAVTSAPPTRADAARLLRGLRGHWGIENRAHWVRDVTMDEDRCQVRTGAAPEVFAACRNLALTLVRRAGGTNIAAALRTYAGRPHQAVALVLGRKLT